MILYSLRNSKKNCNTLDVLEELLNNEREQFGENYYFRQISPKRRRP